MAGRLSDINNSADLRSALSTLRAAAIYDLFGQIHLHNFFKQINAGEADANELVAQLPEGKMTLQEFIDSMSALGNHALVETKRNANRALTRNLFKEAFRITDAYCRASEQTNALKATDWFEFARLLANATSHDFRFKFGTYDQSKLPVSYAGATIEAKDNGKPVSMKLEIIIQVVDELIAFSGTIE